MNYEDKPIMATVKEHKHYIANTLRGLTSDGILSDEDLVEQGYVIEEVGRFMEYLSDRDEDETIKVFYHDGLNHFEVLEKGE